jgi:hypothetical protein
MRISESEYLTSFQPTRDKALERALDIRKFEIELYWKRATYFWTFIAVTLAGYAAVQASDAIAEKKDLSVVLSCLGVLFSVGWHCVNRGSKQWQENWENHVDMLEDGVIGPLYKTILRRRPPENLNEHFINAITGPWPVSVSGINQIISIYVVLLWLVLLYKSLAPFSRNAPINCTYTILVGGTALACIGFVTVARTHIGPHGHIADRRESHIKTT